MRAARSAATPAGPPPDPVLYTIQDLCRRTQLSYYTVRREIATGRLRSVKVGKRRLVTEEQLQEWIALIMDEARDAPLPGVESARGQRRRAS
jgi:excisionase family DNA binding protein